MTELEAAQWETQREKGKLRWVLRDLQVGVLGFSVLYLIFMAIGRELSVMWLIVWTVMGTIWTAYSWSDFETRFAAFQHSHAAGQRPKGEELSQTGNQ